MTAPEDDPPDKAPSGLTTRLDANNGNTVATPPGADGSSRELKQNPTQPSAGKGKVVLDAASAADPTIDPSNNSPSVHNATQLQSSHPNKTSEEASKSRLAPGDNIQQGPSIEQSLTAVDDRLNFQSAEKPIVSTGAGISEWSHQQLSTHRGSDAALADPLNPDDEWQDMPAIAEYDLYDDDGRLIARAEATVEDDTAQYTSMGGAVKGYTRVQIDEDAKSATSMDDDTAYLFKNGQNHALDEFDDDARDAASQMQTTKSLFTDSQKIAYVGLVRLAMADMSNDLHKLERTRGAKKELDFSTEAMKMWGQKTMVNLYAHMELDPAGIDFGSAACRLC